MSLHDDENAATEIPLSPATLSREAALWLKAVRREQSNVPLLPLLDASKALQALGCAPSQPILVHSLSAASASPVYLGLSDSREASRVCDEPEPSSAHSAAAAAVGPSDVSVAVFEAHLPPPPAETSSFLLSGLSQDCFSQPTQPSPAPAAAPAATPLFRPLPDDAAFLDFLEALRARASFAIAQLCWGSGVFCGLEFSWGGRNQWTIPLPPPPRATAPHAPAPLLVAGARPPASPWAALPRTHPTVFTHILSFLASELDVLNLPAAALLHPARCAPGRVCSAWRGGHRAHSAAQAARVVQGRWRGLFEVLFPSPSLPPPHCTRQVVAWGTKALFKRLLAQRSGAAAGAGAPPCALWQGVQWQDPSVAIWMLDPDAPPPPQQAALGHFLTRDALGAVAAEAQAAAAGSADAGSPPLLHNPGLCEDDLAQLQLLLLHSTAASALPTASPAQAAWLLMCTLGSALRRSGLARAFLEVEMPTQCLLGEVEMRGARVDAAALGRCLRVTGERMCVLEAAALDVARSHLHALPPGALSAGGRGLKMDHTPALCHLVHGVLGAGGAITRLYVAAFEERRRRAAAGAAGGKVTSQTLEGISRALKAQGWPTPSDAAAFCAARELGAEALQLIASASKAASEAEEEEQLQREREERGAQPEGEPEAHLGSKKGPFSTPAATADLARLRSAALIAGLLKEWREVAPIHRAAQGLMSATGSSHSASCVGGGVNNATGAGAMDSCSCAGSGGSFLTVHPTCKTTTATGRIAVLSPPLQALTKARLVARAARLSVWEELEKLRGSSASSGGGGGGGGNGGLLLTEPLAVLVTTLAGGAVRALAGSAPRLVRLDCFREGGSGGALAQVSFVPRSHSRDVSAFTALFVGREKEGGMGSGEGEKREEEEEQEEEEEEELVLCVPQTAVFRLGAPLYLPSESQGVGGGGAAAAPPPVRICLRSCIWPPSPGYLLFSADYSAAEIRLLAHFSADHALRGILCDPQQPDIFSAMAAQRLKKPPSAVSPAERSATKQLIYALLYGAGRELLAQQMGCTTAQALAHVASFYACFPSLRAFSEAVVAGARDKGFVATWGGRRRMFPALQQQQQSAGPGAGAAAASARQAVNTLCQGSVADLMKQAMLGVARESGGGGWLSLVLQVHDELVYEVAQGRAEEGRALVKRVMEEVGKGLSVPLRVKVSRAAPTWGEI